MHRIILIVACSFVLALADTEDCKQLGHPKYLKCCKVPPPVKEKEKEVMKECFKLMRKPPSCEADICSAKKHGFAASEDGKFDKEALTSVIQDMHKDEPELVKNVIENCINGDLSIYGPPDFCDLIKLRHCIDAQLLLACTDIETEGKCSGVKELVEKCRAS